MKKLLSAYFLLTITAAIAQQKAIPEAIKNSPRPAVAFTENKGQVSNQEHSARPDVLYVGHNGQMNFQLRKAGISYQLQRTESWKRKSHDTALVPDQVTTYRVDVGWLNINPGYSVVNDAALPGYDNYYLPVCPNGVTHVRSYTGVTFKNIYNTIDLHYYQKDGTLKYDYLVAPYADYTQIRLTIKGAEIIQKEDGSLRLKTPLGEIEEGAPVAFQNGKQVAAHWVIDKNILSFKIDNYDPSVPLIIDPVTRTWGTYYGDGSNNEAWGCCTDPFGNIYISGVNPQTGGTYFATAGAHQTTEGGYFEAYLAKFDATGMRLWGTYYGGISDQDGKDCTTDKFGNVYMVGLGGGNNGVDSILATPGAHQPIPGGGGEDSYIVKFDQAGVRLWGTYYGGTGDDLIESCITDSTGNLYIAGSTSSGTGIATSGTHQSVDNGNTDAFLVKFNTNGVRLWGTYYGGNEQEHGYSCTLNANQEIYLCGSTRTPTSNTIASVGCHQSVYSGNTDGFLAKFTANGIRLWGTYYGGTQQDVAESVAVDAISGAVYIAGRTFSSAAGNSIATPGAHQTSYGGNLWDGFLVKFDASGNRQWGTYYGGTGQDIARTCEADAIGNVYLGGQSGSANVGVISTPGSHQPVFGGGVWDGFLIYFDSNGSRQWGTYYGDGGWDYVNAIVIDAWGAIYFAGYTGSLLGTVIATSGTFQPIAGGDYDAYLVKFNDCLPDSVALTSQVDATCYGFSDGSASVVASGGTGFSYFWSPYGGFSDTAVGLSAGTYTCTVINSCGSGATQTVVINQQPPIIPNLQVTPQDICIGASAFISASPTGGNGTLSYSWSPVADTTSSFTDSPVSTTNYYVNITDSTGCPMSDSITVIVHPLPVVALGNDTTVCGTSLVLDAQNSGSTFLWSNNSTNQTITVTLTANPVYSVVVTDSYQCSSADTISVLFNPLPVVTFTLPFDMCLHDAGIPLNGTPAGGVYSGNGINGNVFDALLAGVGPHVISYAFTDANSCSDTVITTIIVDPCVGVIENQTSPVTINAIEGQCVISVAEGSSVEVVNALGQVIFSKQLQAGVNSFDTKFFPGGMYLVRVTGKADAVYIQKVVF
jgi:hypothetical protein